MSEIFLGCDDGAISETEETDPYFSRIGGVASWPTAGPHSDTSIPLNLRKCRICNEPLSLLAQVFCPSPDGSLDRFLYVFFCNCADCSSLPSESWVAFRLARPALSEDVEPTPFLDSSTRRLAFQPHALFLTEEPAREGSDSDSDDDETDEDDGDEEIPPEVLAAAAARGVKVSPAAKLSANSKTVSKKPAAKPAPKKGKTSGLISKHDSPEVKAQKEKEELEALDEVAGGKRRSVRERAELAAFRAFSRRMNDDPSQMVRWGWAGAMKPIWPSVSDLQVAYPDPTFVSPTTSVPLEGDAKVAAADVDDIGVDAAGSPAAEGPSPAVPLEKERVSRDVSIPTVPPCPQCGTARVPELQVRFPCMFCSCPSSRTSTSILPTVLHALDVVSASFPSHPRTKGALPTSPAGSPLQAVAAAPAPSGKAKGKGTRKGGELVVDWSGDDEKPSSPAAPSEFPSDVAKAPATTTVTVGKSTITVVSEVSADAVAKLRAHGQRGHGGDFGTAVVMACPSITCGNGLTMEPVLVQMMLEDS